MSLDQFWEIVAYTVFLFIVLFLVWFYYSMDKLESNIGELNVSLYVLEVGTIVLLSEQCIIDLKISDAVVPDGIKSCNETIAMLDQWNPNDFYELINVVPVDTFKEYTRMLYKLRKNIKEINKITQEEFISGGLYGTR